MKADEKHRARPDGFELSCPVGVRDQAAKESERLDCDRGGDCQSGTREGCAEEDGHGEAFGDFVKGDCECARKMFSSEAVGKGMKPECEEHRQTKAMQARGATIVIVVVGAGRADGMDVAICEPEEDEAREEVQGEAEATCGTEKQQDATNPGEQAKSGRGWGNA